MILVYEGQKMHVRDTISHVLEEYLEAIWRLQEKTSPVKTGELAEAASGDSRRCHEYAHPP